MKYKTLMLIKAISAFIVGVPMFLVPCKFLPVFGITLSPGGRFAARGYGAAILGYFVLCWFARNAEQSSTRKSIIRAMFIYDLFAFIAALYSQLRGAMNGIGWLVVGVYFIFTLAFGWLLIRGK